MKPTITASLIAFALGIVSCSDALRPNGAVLWSVPGSSAGTAAVDDSRVFFLGRNNEVIALDKRTGARRWTAPTGYSGGSPISGMVLVAGSLVVAGDGNLVAFDRATGAGRWVFDPSVGTHPGIFHFATDGTRIYAGSATGHVYAVDLQGKELWTTNLRDSIAAAAYSPVHHEGLVYVCFKRFTLLTSGGIVVLNGLTGQIVWRAEFPPTPPNNATGCYDKLVIAGDLVVGATVDGNIHAYNRLTGAHAWSAPQVTGLGPDVVANPLMDSRPLAAGAGVVVAGSTTTWILGHDAGTGAELWRASSRRGSVFYPLGVDHSAVYATGTGDELSSYDLRTGALRWRITQHHDDPFAAAPFIDGDRVYIGTMSSLMAIQR